MSNHPNRGQIRVPVRLVEELAGALDLALSRLEWCGESDTPAQRQADANARLLVDEARGRVRIIGRRNREMGDG